jgi:RNA polymerase sigma factor (sigma-70 family)
VDKRRARFEQLYQQHAGPIAAYLLRRVDGETAQDVVAETFLVAWRRLDEVPAEPLPWLYGVARRTLANHRRAAGRHASLRRRLDRAFPVAEQGNDREVLDALARLNERDREVLMLIAWEGLRSTEAAAVLGCSPVACRLRLHRARGRLARALGRPAERQRKPSPAEELP